MTNSQFFQVSDKLLINKNFITKIIEVIDDENNYAVTCEIYLLNNTEAIILKSSLSELCKNL